MTDEEVGLNLYPEAWTGQGGLEVFLVGGGFLLVGLIGREVADKLSGQTFREKRQWGMKIFNGGIMSSLENQRESRAEGGQQEAPSGREERVGGSRRLAGRTERVENVGF
ncbi:hypothetical protein Salat_2667300 [Sesamum alatum]|uniref:Uncharacterized protein n=1 Tax=Sesamum alatum TaxID=300844 RepID=A0AAE1XPE2_9LAMI|nr:hypothetical protein Salat_2667300 [Sesamum alatum]